MSLNSETWFMVLILVDLSISVGSGLLSTTADDNAENSATSKKASNRRMAAQHSLKGTKGTCSSSSRMMPECSEERPEASVNLLSIRSGRLSC